MIAWLKSVFHCHKWVEIDKGELVDHAGITRGRFHDVRCEHCGKIKRFKLMA